MHQVALSLTLICHSSYRGVVEFLRDIVGVSISVGKPCHGDVFHILHQCESLANVLGSVAQGATTRRQAMDLKMDVAKVFGCGNSRALQLGMPRRAEVQTCRLAKDIKTLTQWLRRDVLALVGPCLATRVELFDFVTAELVARVSPGLQAHPPGAYCTAKPA
jgi:hypothetical protein